MTYRNCKMLYEIKKTNNEITNEFISKQLENLDVFLLNGRITTVEYDELIELLRDTESM